jgi:hypothetical protein
MITDSSAHEEEEEQEEEGRTPAGFGDHKKTAGSSQASVAPWLIRAFFLSENTAVQITKKTPQLESPAAISKSGALNFLSQTTQRHKLPFAFSVSSSLRCPPLPLHT